MNTLLVGKNKFTQILFTVLLVTGLLFSTGGIAQADEANPPVVSDPVSTDASTVPVEQTTSAESPTSSGDAVVPDTQLDDTGQPTASSPDDGSQTQSGIEPTEAVVATEATVQTEETQAVEEVPTIVAIQETVTVDPPTTEDESLVEEVVALAKAGAVLMSEDEPVPLASELASETLNGADPYFTRGGVTYQFFETGGTCPAGTLDVTCFISDTPIQDAIDKYASVSPLAGEENTIYVLPGTYGENVTINVPDLTLYGDPGDETSAGAGTDAPVLEGTSGTGINITSEGVSIIGFIIKGFDTGILINVVSGNNSILISNNDITENNTGIAVNKYTGSPGTEIHYNKIYDNTSYGLVNNQENKNVQFIEAQNNYWGCETGPVVYGAETTGSPSSRRTGYWQYPSGDYLGNTLPEGCQLLDGLQEMWDFQKNTDDWSPFKINLDASDLVMEPTATQQTPEPTTTTPEPTTTTPEPTTTTPEPTTTTPEPTTTTLEPTTVTPEPTTVTPEPTTVTPEPTTATPVPTTATPVPPVIVPVTGGPAPLAAAGFVIPVTGGQRIITAGLAHTCMTVNSEVVCWGLNDFGQLGNGAQDNQSVPVFVEGLNNVIDLTSGANFTCALTADGQIWCWGENTYGQLGDGTQVNHYVPVQVKGLPQQAVDFTAGDQFVCARLENNKLWCWGLNNDGQLNDGTTINRSVPVKSNVDVQFNMISGGFGNLLGETGGSVGVWNNLTQGTINNLGLASDISANRFVDGGCAVTFAGTIKCWGADSASSSIEGSNGAVMVSTGPAFGCFVDQNLMVSCWGDNTFGQLGNGKTENSDAASLVIGLANVVDLATGGQHGCALIGDGNTAMCWGDNTYGQLGDGSNMNSSIPVFVNAPIHLVN